VNFGHIAVAAHACGLDVVGAFHPSQGDGAPGNTGTLVLLGPYEPGFWDRLQSSPEFQGNVDNPVDAWSTRVVTTLAKNLDATPLFPFGGPPYHPFIAWAKLTGSVWTSPVGLLVHSQAGLMVSFRGALALREKLSLPAPPVSPPCDSCAKSPCLSACPVAALSQQGYDTGACHGWLDTDGGQDCMQMGCRVRRSCPVSQSYGRMNAQSALHMRAFHKG